MSGPVQSLQRERAKAFIEQHLASPSLSPGEVADAVHMSRSALYRLFPESRGVGRYILEARLNRAWLLLSGDAGAPRISQVAYRTGFLSEAHFCRAFRRKFGLSPSALKQAQASHPRS
ncbi:MAG: hypothetical protein JWO72_1100 [Caulobacteraceae bacterium]|jgi:AraC-like DNA-binding protein|nr:hypothetical protein [Caulobacteraceae bacterium]